MELRHLRSFLAVAEERHFGRAAKRLHLAQPPLSRHVQALEAELGFSLFDRNRRRVELTPAGAALFGQVRHLLAALDDAVREASRASQGQLGRIAVGYPWSLAYSGLTELLRAYRLRFPQVDIALREAPPAAQVEALKSGALDVGFIRGPLEDPSLHYECVRKEELLAALPADHALAARKRVPLAALAGEPFVLFPRARGPAFFDQLMMMCQTAGFVPRIVQEAPQLDVISLIAAGFGVSILPGSTREVSRPGLALRPIVGAPRSELLVTWRAGSVSPVVREFLAVVRDVGVHAPRAATDAAKRARRVSSAR